MASQGYGFEAAYTSDFVGNLNGGAQRGTAYMGNLDLSLSIDAQAAWKIPGASLFVYFLGNHGSSINAFVGDAQGTNNIDTDAAFLLYEAWYQQDLIDGRLSFKAGLYDLNSEFDAMETAGLFLNSSHGIGPDYAQSGVNGPSIFPMTSLAFRASGWITSDLYLQAAVLDGVPGHPTESGFHVILAKEDGALISGETGWVQGVNDDDNRVYRKVAVGGWHYTAKVSESILGNDISENNQGVYVLAEQVLWENNRHEDQNIAAFARIGFAPNHINQIERYIGAGVVLSAPFTGRPADQIGIAVAHATNSQNIVENDNTAATHETAIELTYHVSLFDWLQLQPDFQFIINPGMTTNVKSASVFGIRFAIAY